MSQEMRVYVGTYAKYNNGSIEGKWLDLSDYSDREGFYGACAELHSDEEDPEFMFQDWEGIPNGMISECSIEPGVWDLLEAFENHNEDAVRAYCDEFGEWNESDFEDRYCGQWDSFEAYAEDFVESCGILSGVPDDFVRYFDYSAFARDLSYDYTCSDEGHVFRN